MPATERKRSGLTTPDLVLLSLLAERPMHGYQADLELERREVRDWAAISKPQVYYSLEKLARLGLIREAESDDVIAGPERQVYATTPRGRSALAAARTRHLDHAARAAAIPHLDGSLLASPPRRLRPPASPPRCVSAPRACARESHAQIHSSGSRPRVSRSPVDGHAHNLAVSHRAALATPPPAHPAAPSPGMQFRLRRRSETISARRIYLRRMRFLIRTWRQDANQCARHSPLRRAFRHMLASFPRLIYTSMLPCRIKGGGSQPLCALGATWRSSGAG
jgi:DNA-binding PadR family transcriptional regulator